MLILEGISPISCLPQLAFTLLPFFSSQSESCDLPVKSKSSPSIALLTENKHENMNLSCKKNKNHDQSVAAAAQWRSALSLSVITFKTIPPGNRSTTPPPLPDSPLPPLSIRPTPLIYPTNHTPPLLLVFPLHPSPVYFPPFP